MDDRERMGELRSACSHESDASWWDICHLLERWQDLDALEHQVIPYVRATLASWTIATARPGPERWLREFFATHTAGLTLERRRLACLIALLPHLSPPAYTSVLAFRGAGHHASVRLDYPTIAASLGTVLYADFGPEVHRGALTWLSQHDAPQLTRLALGAPTWPGDVMEHALEASWLSQLAWLRLSCRDSAPVVSFLTQATFGALGSLDLSGVQLSARDLEQVLEQPWSTQITELVLDHCPLEREHAQVLAAWPGLPRLRKIELAHCAEFVEQGGLDVIMALIHDDARDAIARRYNEIIE